MALSTIVEKELKDLQCYFKKLYFLRWFIPAAMKEQLSLLEKMDIINSEEQIKSAVNSLCAPFLRPSLFARFILFCFSGLGRFADGELMQHVKILAINDLLSQDNVAFMANYDSLMTGVEGLQLLKEQDLKLVDQYYERLAHIIRVKQFDINETLKSEFYNKIAKQAQYQDYATEIEIMNSVEACRSYVCKLLVAQNISNYGKAIILLATQHLLPGTGMAENGSINMLDEELLEELRQPIVDTLETHSCPIEMAEAVVELQKNRQLDKFTFEQVKASAAPLDLAKLIKECVGFLDQQNVGKIEPHRKNLDTISKRNIMIQAEQRLDFEYCQTLVDLLDASQPSGVSQSGLDMYNTCYTRINTNQRESDAQNLIAFICTNALDQPYGPVFLTFLNSRISEPQFFVYMQLCTEFAKPSYFVTAENAQSIVNIIQNFSNLGELLKRVQDLKFEKNATTNPVLLLRGLVAKINRESLGGTFDPKKSIYPTGLRHRLSSMVMSPDLENGVKEESRLVQTPGAEKKQKEAPSSSSVLGNIAAFFGWTESVEKKKKNDDEIYGYKERDQNNFPFSLNKV